MREREYEEELIRESEGRAIRWGMDKLGEGEGEDKQSKGKDSMTLMTKRGMNSTINLTMA